MANQYSDRMPKTPDEIEDRRRFVMHQRRKGHSFDAICDLILIQFGYRISIVQCADDFRQIMQRRATELAVDTDAMRALMLDQLDSILIKTLEKAEGGDLDAVDSVIKIMQRKARLLGTDAPTKVEKEVVTARLTREQMLTRIEQIKAKLLEPRKDDPINVAVDAVIEEVPRKDTLINNAENPSESDPSRSE